MKIWCISDTHGLYGRLTIPDVDMLVFAGDAGTYKRPISNANNVLDFIEWIESLPIPYKVWIAGNHDTSIEAGLVKPLELCKSSVYLEHNSIKHKELNIFGTPWTPEFYDWAFNANVEKEKELWNEIPDETDIMISHGPIRGIMDKCSQKTYTPNKHVGSEWLYRRIAQIQPKLFICGHIHENSGQKQIGNTLFVNCAVVDDNYELVNNGEIIEI